MRGHAHGAPSRGMPSWGRRAVATGGFSALLAAAMMAMAVSPNILHGSSLVAPVRAQQQLSQLWNAAANDEAGGDYFDANPSSFFNMARETLALPPSAPPAAVSSPAPEPALAELGSPESVTGKQVQWLANQRDSDEMRQGQALPAPGKNRVFREDMDHQRNYEGSYVQDNSIGVRVDDLKAPTQMLDMTAETSSIADWARRLVWHVELGKQTAEAPNGWLGKIEAKSHKEIATEEGTALRFADQKLLSGPTAIQEIEGYFDGSE